MRSSFYISFGIWIAILPFLGIPGSWRNILVAASGLFLAFTSLGPIILKKLQTKSKAKKKNTTSSPPLLLVKGKGEGDQQNSNPDFGSETPS